MTITFDRTESADNIDATILDIYIHSSLNIDNNPFNTLTKHRSNRKTLDVSIKYYWLDGTIRYEEGRLSSKHLLINSFIERSWKKSFDVRWTSKTGGYLAGSDRNRSPSTFFSIVQQYNETLIHFLPPLLLLIPFFIPYQSGGARVSVFTGFRASV